MCGQLTIIGYSLTLADHCHFLMMLPKAAQCGEGVGIALSPAGVDTWHAAGDTRCAVSSRIVTAWLNLALAVLRQAGSTRCSFDLFLNVMSVYAPTFRAQLDT